MHTFFERGRIFITNQQNKYITVYYLQKARKKNKKEQYNKEKERKEREKKENGNHL